MNDNSRSTPGGGVALAAMGFALGAVVGAGIALLLAPATGAETRRRVADAGRRMGGEARRQAERVLDTASDLGQNTSAALKAGREAFEQGRS